MKKEIHPTYAIINVSCSCGYKFVTRSTVGRDLHLEICSHCHPFYTGQQKTVDAGGRVDRFRKKYDKSRILEQRAAQQKADAAKAVEKPKPKTARKSSAKKKDSA